jgi:hypothetical protein
VKVTTLTSTKIPDGLSIKANILIIPGTTGIAREIFSSLHFTKGLTLFGAGESVLASENMDYAGFRLLSRLGDFGLLDEITQMVSDWSIDFIFFAHDSWIYEFRSFDKIGGAILIGHCESAIEKASFKSETYRNLAPKIPIPKVFSSTEDVREFPVFVKPDRGQGSVNASEITTSDELRSHDVSGALAQKEWVLTEYLPGPEFTVDCFSDDESRILVAEVRERVSVQKGIAVSTRIVPERDLSSWAEIISSVLRLRGAWFFQAKTDARGQKCLLEVGLRIAGASGVLRLKGINLSLMALYQALGMRVSVIEQESRPLVSVNNFSFGFRYCEIFVDFDDTILVNSQPNLPLLSFLLNSQSQGVPVTLISKNAGDLSDTLSRLQLSRYFDYIIQVPRNEDKARYIRTKEKFLFIDDSFAERRGVKGVFLDQVLTIEGNALNGKIFA